METTAKRPLGGSNLTVSAAGLGTAALAVPYGAPGRERAAPLIDDARRAIAAALDAGITFVDTAPAYGPAEELVGEVAGASDCVIATKVAIPDEGWPALDAVTARAFVRRSAEDSARALRREHIDVLQVHNADVALIESGVVPAALAELRAEGTIRLAGATVHGEAHALAAAACSAFDVVQVAMSALDRRPERRVLPAAADTGTAVMTRSALMRGVLSAAGRDLHGPFAPLSAAADEFRSAIGTSWNELPGAAVAFALARPGVACVVLGPRDAAELEALLTGAQRFAEMAARLDSGRWGSQLPAELLDPTCWPALEAKLS